MIILFSFFLFISVHSDLKEALKGATYIQENTPERLEIKKSIFVELDRLLREIGNDTAIVGSSTSTLKGSLFTDGLSIQDRSIVVHPVLFLFIHGKCLIISC